MTHVEKQHQVTAKKIQTALEKSAVDNKPMGVSDAFVVPVMKTTHRVVMCFVISTTNPLGLQLMVALQKIKMVLANVVATSVTSARSVRMISLAQEANARGAR